MKKIPSYKYLHIVSGKITELEEKHPMDGPKGEKRLLLMDSLLNDLGIEKFEYFDNDSKDLFNINLDETAYTIFLDHPDGGGKDINENKTTKKIEIPFARRNFQNIIAKNQPILVINIYVPLDGDYKLDFSKRIYIILVPKKIHSSEIFSKIKAKTNSLSEGINKDEKINSSNRWFELEDILEVENTKDWKYNNVKNLYIVHPEKIKFFFEKNLKKEYVEMMQQTYDHSLSDKNIGEINEDDLYDFINNDENEIENFDETKVEMMVSKKKLKRDQSIIKDFLKKNQFCVGCNSRETFKKRNENLMFFEVHHFIPYNINVQKKFQKNLDHKLNLISLCPNCHKKIHLSEFNEQEEMIKLIAEVICDVNFYNAYPEFDLNELFEIYKNLFTLWRNDNEDGWI